MRAELAEQIPLPATLSISNYLEVNSAAIPGLMAAYHQELFNVGVVNWNERFNCTDFTDFFLGYAGAETMVQTFHSAEPAAKPAIFALWYHPNTEIEGHSIIVIITEKGLIYIDPQGDTPTHLTKQELLSVYHLRS